MKKNKVPRLFRKKYTEKKFNTKVIKRIHIPREREMIEALYEKNDEALLVLKGEIPDEIIMKLKPLAKSIKKNRGLVTKWKLIVLLIIVGSVTIFNVLFKDRLIETSTEKGLESIFGARTDIENLHLSLFKGILSFSGMSIADADKPMYNLVETGRAEIKINMRELAFKRFHLEEIVLQNVLWNTLRQSDGSLVKNVKAVEKIKENGSPSLRETLAFNSGDFDYKKILEEQKSHLKSLELLSGNNAQIEESLNRWKDLLDNKEDEIGELTEKINSLKSLNTGNITDVDEARALVNQLNSYYPEIEKLRKEVTVLSSDINTEKDRLLTSGQMFEDALNSDLAYLGDSLDISMGDIKTLGSDLAESYIRARWNQYYEYGIKAWKIVQKFQNRENGETKKRAGIKRSSGRNILFPTPDKADFFIQHIAITGGDESSGRLEMEIFSISSEPDKTAEPTKMTLFLSQDNQNINLRSTLDLKTESEVLFEMDFNSSGHSLEIEEGIPALGLENFSSSVEILGKLSADRGTDYVLSEIDVKLSDVAIVQETGKDFLSQSVSTLFNSIEKINLSGEIQVGKAGINSVSVESDFDKIINDKLGDYLSNLDKVISEELKSNLVSFIDPEFKANQILSSSLDSLGVQSLNQISDVDRVKKTLDQKISEVEKKVDAIGAELKAEAESQVKKEAESILNKAKDAIKLPGF